MGSSRLASSVFMAAALSAGCDDRKASERADLTNNLHVERPVATSVGTGSGFAYYLSFDVRPTSQLDRPNCTVDLRVRFTAGRPDSNQSTNSNDQFEPFSTTVNCSASTTVRFGTFSILLSPSWVGGESPHAVINYTYTSRL